MLTPVKIKKLTLTNYKIHEHAALILEERSVKLKGDTETGKSTIMQALEAFFMMRAFPTNPVTKGKEEMMGAMEINLDGQTYKVTRRFSGKTLKGFEVYVDGKFVKDNWSDIVTRIFGGVDPGQYYLDYAKLWYHNNTTETRFEYLMKCALGEIYEQNKKEIKSITERRREIGSKRQLYIGRLQLSPFHGQDIDKLEKEYKEPKDFKKAQDDKEKALEKRVDVVALSNELNQVREANEQATEYADELKECRDVELPDLERQLQEIQKKIAAKQQQIKSLEDKVKKHPVDEKKEKELEKRLQTVNEDNEKIEQEANAAYDRKVKEINDFNALRLRFEDYKREFEEHEKLNKEWNDFTTNIDKIEQQTKDLFKARIPLKEIEIVTLKQVSRRWEKVDKDEKLDDNVKTTQAIWYDGQEMSLENISTGQSIRLTVKLQQTMYPNSQFRVLFLPNSQNLGGKAQEFIKEAIAAGYQLIVEQTIANEKFGWEFINEDVPDEPAASAERAGESVPKKEPSPPKKETAARKSGSSSKDKK